jgi:mono/diheme cytochrome c family protein
MARFLHRSRWSVSAPRARGRHEEVEMAAMKHVFPVMLLATAGAALSATAQQTVEAPFVSEGGDALFRTYCSSCHGRAGKGDGPISQHLRTVPPDLTQFAARAGGKFDEEKVFKIIDGRKPVSGHGGSDMPVWGDAFKQSGQGRGTDEAVKARIVALVEHLRAIQAQQAGGKPPQPAAPVR